MRRAPPVSVAEAVRSLLALLVGMTCGRGGRRTPTQAKVGLVWATPLVHFDLNGAAEAAPLRDRAAAVASSLGAPSGLKPRLPSEQPPGFAVALPFGVAGE